MGAQELTYSNRKSKFQAHPYSAVYGVEEYNDSNKECEDIRNILNKCGIDI